MTLIRLRPIPCVGAAVVLAAVGYLLPSHILGTLSLMLFGIAASNVITGCFRARRLRNLRKRRHTSFKNDSEGTSPMTYAEASEKLVEFCPELNEAYLQEIEWWKPETPGPHIVYEDLLFPHIERLSAVGDRAGLQRAFALIERIANSGDVRLQELATSAVLERIAGDVGLSQTLGPYLGPSTRKLLKRVRATS